jgi:hypothetical protein
VIVARLPHDAHAAFTKLFDDGVVQERPPSHGSIPRC